MQLKKQCLKEEGLVTREALFKTNYPTLPHKNATKSTTKTYPAVLSENRVSCLDGEKYDTKEKKASSPDKILQNGMGSPDCGRLRRCLPNLTIQCKVCDKSSDEYSTNLDDRKRKIELLSAFKKRGLIKFTENENEEQNMILSLHETILQEIQSVPLIQEAEKIYLIFNNFDDFFDEIKVLGQGTSAVVKLCKSKDSKGQKFAVKISEYLGDDERLLQMIKSFKMRAGLKHRNIIEASGCYVDLCKKKIYLIKELIEGWNLMELLTDIGHFGENEAARIIRDVILGAQFLHSNGICHRDLKLDNVMISKDWSSVKITDFSVSKYFEDHKSYSVYRRDNYKMWTFTGTIAYLPPEVFQDLEYTENIDAWSVGVMLYMMLTGLMPFEGEYQEDLIASISSGKYDTKDSRFTSLSDEAKHLISCLLQKDPSKRYTLFEALSHPWIVKNCDHEPSPSFLSEKAIHAVQIE